MNWVSILQITTTLAIITTTIQTITWQAKSAEIKSVIFKFSTRPQRLTKPKGIHIYFYPKECYDHREGANDKANGNADEKANDIKTSHEYFGENGAQQPRKLNKVIVVSIERFYFDV